MFYMLILYHRFIYLFFTVLRKYAVCKQTYPKESFSGRRKYLQQLIITQEFFVELHGNIHLFLPWIVFTSGCLFGGFSGPCNVIRPPK